MSEKAGESPPFSSFKFRLVLRQRAFAPQARRPPSSSSEAEALEPRLASIVDAQRARLLAIRERHQEFGQLGVGTVRGDETVALLDARLSFDTIEDTVRKKAPRRRHVSAGQYRARDGCGSSATPSLYGCYNLTASSTNAETLALAHRGGALNAASQHIC
jgi:hypothetical protein